MPSCWASSRITFSIALHCRVAHETSGRIRIVAPLNSVSLISQAFRRIISLCVYWWILQITFLGWFWFEDRGPRALWIWSKDTFCGSVSPATFLNIANAVAARSSVPVALGMPRSHKLFILLRSSISSRCSCWDSMAAACVACASSTRCSLHSSTNTLASPSPILSVREVMSLCTTAMCCLWDVSILLASDSMLAPCWQCLQ